MARGEARKRAGVPTRMLAEDEIMGLAIMPNLPNHVMYSTILLRFRASALRHVDVLWTGRTNVMKTWAWHGMGWDGKEQDRISCTLALLKPQATLSAAPCQVRHNHPLLPSLALPYSASLCLTIPHSALLYLTLP